MRRFTNRCRHITSHLVVMKKDFSPYSVLITSRTPPRCMSFPLLYLMQYLCSNIALNAFSELQRVRGINLSSLRTRRCTSLTVTVLMIPTISSKHTSVTCLRDQVVHFITHLLFFIHLMLYITNELSHVSSGEHVPMYLYPVRNWQKRKTWYNLNKPVGINTIEKFMERICKAAGIEKVAGGKGKYVNQSARREAIISMHQVITYPQCHIVTNS